MNSTSTDGGKGNMKKRVFVILIALFMTVALIPSEAKAANNVVMTSNVFISYLQHVVDRGDSKYGSGGQKSSGKYDGTNIYFDCWGLGESILATRGAIVYNRDSSRNPYDLYDASIIPKTNLSGDNVKKIMPVEQRFFKYSSR